MNVGCGPGSGSGGSAAATSRALSAAGLEAAPGDPPPPLQEAARSKARPPRAAHARLENMFPAVYAEFVPAKSPLPGRRAGTEH